MSFFRRDFSLFKGLNALCFGSLTEFDVARYMAAILLLYKCVSKLTLIPFKTHICYRLISLCMYLPERCLL
jgi:hypothetical protein